MKFSIEKRQVFLIFSIVVFLAGLIVVFAVTPNPGHARAEIDWTDATCGTQCITGFSLTGTPQCAYCGGGGGGVSSVTSTSGGGLLTSPLAGIISTGSIGLNKAALTSCGTSTSGKIWWDSTNSRLACGTDQGGAGAVSSVTGQAGSGITASPTTGAVILTTDTSILQKRVSSMNCYNGNQAIDAIYEDGTVACTYKIPLTWSCPSGQAITGYNRDTGQFSCGTSNSGNWYPGTAGTSCFIVCGNLGLGWILETSTGFVCKYGGPNPIGGGSQISCNGIFYCYPAQPGCVGLADLYKVTQCYCG